MSEKEKVEEEAEKPKKAARKRARAAEKGTPVVKRPRKAKAKKKEEEVEAEAPKEAEVKPVSKGDFILVELTGRVEETGEVFDTTSEEQAKSAGIHGEGKVYGPRLVVAGDEWVLRGLDKRLEGLKIGEETKVEIPPEEAFGQRDPENVRMVPYRLLRSKGVNPALGSQVEVEGRTATVRSIGAGRVQLDYNPPLSGRKIEYAVKVTKRYETEEEKLKALLSRRFQGIDVDKFTVKLSKKVVRIEEPEDIFFAENLQIAKRAVALDIQRYFPEVDEVGFIEVVKRKAPSQ